MRFEKFTINDSNINDVDDINKILTDNNLHWLIDCEIENADIEIKHKTIIWNNGIFYTGNWFYGIWKNGIFYGLWENGIWIGGEFKGKWISGIKL